MDELPPVISKLFAKTTATEETMEQSGGSKSADHLCVLVHGLWGNPGHLKYMSKCLREKFPEEKLHILVAKRNAGSFTYDGVQTGGERVCVETEEELEKLEKNGQKIKKFSIIGYSLGGLVARYSVGLLDRKGFFEKITPVNFTTFATPHLGVRTPLKGWHNSLWNVLGSRTLSLSGRQLFTIDDFRETGKPLLEVLADPESIFIKGLAKFQRRTLYANILNDRSAAFHTTSIEKKDPYTSLDKITINYVKGYNNVILDPDTPYGTIDPSKAQSLTSTARLLKSGQNVISIVPIVAIATLAIPFALVGFLINSGVQTLNSNRRIQLHEKGLAGIEVGKYNVPFMMAGVREAVEDAYGNLNNAQENEYLEGESEEEAARSSKSSSDSTQTRQTGHQSRRSISSLSEGDDPEKSSALQQDVPTLALAPYQFRMIKALDDVGFRKFRVHIKKSRHSHAAIIVRMDKESFDEGREVIRHWLDNEFVI